MSLIFAQGIPGLCNLKPQEEAAYREWERLKEKRDTLLEVFPANKDSAELAQAIMAANKAGKVARQASGTLKKALKKSSGLSFPPRTHALVIGVGAYPHLLGGASTTAAHTLGLGQLTTSVTSAMAFADWLLSGYRNTERPLGTIELLLSPGVYKPSPQAQSRLGVEAGSKVAVERATLANIKAAFARWHERCKDRNMTALFYFCGHGVEDKTGPLLLPEDFGADALRPFDRCIDLAATHEYMGQSLPDTQCFFIDACREEVFDLQASKEKNPGDALIGGTDASFQLRDAPIYFGAARGNQAYGKAGRVSFFTGILLRCLNGMGAAKKVDEKTLLVTTSSLRERILAEVERQNETATVPITCAVGGASNFTRNLNFASVV